MLTWRLPPPPPVPALGAGGGADVDALLVLSFDATPQCLSLEECPLPGPSNTLLAQTVARLCAATAAAAVPHGSAPRVYAQWEVAAALARNQLATSLPARAMQVTPLVRRRSAVPSRAALLAARCSASRRPRANQADHPGGGPARRLLTSTPWRPRAQGVPGRFENTGRIVEHMLRERRLGGDAASSGSGTGGRHAEAAGERWLVLAHPDHLPRVLWTLQAALRHAGGAAARVQLLSAMAPYRHASPMASAAHPARA